MGLYGDQFKEKVAIVTGAGGGIGQAYAEALAREGAAVVVADINTEGAQKVADGIKGEGGNALAVRVDVSEPDSAKEMAAHGAGGSTFSDWWAYKVEAADAIPHNAAIMTRKGVLVSINSDSAEHARRLNTEAAKTI